MQKKVSGREVGSHQINMQTHFIPCLIQNGVPLTDSTTKTDTKFCDT